MCDGGEWECWSDGYESGCVLVVTSVSAFASVSVSKTIVSRTLSVSGKRSASDIWA